MMKTYSITDSNCLIYLTMDTLSHPDEYVYSFGSISGTVPYGRVITALIAFLEDEETDKMIVSSKSVTKTMDKMEEWNAMRSNTLFTIRGPVSHMDTRLFDIEEIADISHCDTPTDAIKILKTFSSRTRMQFKFE
jgi:hypothetical protein